MTVTARDLEHELNSEPWTVSFGQQFKCVELNVVVGQLFNCVELKAVDSSWAMVQHC